VFFIDRDCLARLKKSECVKVSKVIIDFSSIKHIILIRSLLRFDYCSKARNVL